MTLESQIQDIKSQMQAQGATIVALQAQIDHLNNQQTELSNQQTELSNQQTAMASLDRVTATRLVHNEEMNEEEIQEITDLFKLWVDGEAVKIKDLRRYNHVLYECIQAHTTQSDWTPDITPALWLAKGQPAPSGPCEGVADWVQPTGGHDAYQTGDRVCFEDQVWESTIDANVWSPTDYPQGWSLVS